MSSPRSTFARGKAGENRIQQPQRADRSLDGAGETATLQAHPVAGAERLRAGEHGSGDHVAERLLRGETHQDRCERTADGELLRSEAGDAYAVTSAGGLPLAYGMLVLVYYRLAARGEIDEPLEEIDRHFAPHGAHGKRSGP